METERGRLVTEDMKPARFTCKDARVRARPPTSGEEPRPSSRRPLSFVIHIMWQRERD